MEARGPRASGPGGAPASADARELAVAWEIAIPRHAIGVDFLVRVTATAGTGDKAGGLSCRPASRSTVLHWSRHAATVTLSRYQGGPPDAFRYRRLASFPILRPGTDGALIIDGRPFFALGAPGGPLSSDTAGPAPACSATRGRSTTGEAPTVPARRPTRLREWSTAIISELAPLIIPGLVPTATGGVRRAVLQRGVDGPVRQVWEFHRLPATPMRPRLSDPRLTYFTTTDDSGHAALGDTAPGPYIQRQRLEKRDPTAAVSDVVQPIVYRIDASVPAEWVPWIKRGIEEWTPLFEAIGFRHAIVVRTPADSVPPPSAGADSREYVISWNSDSNSAMAAEWRDHTCDPRTGEILNGRIVFSASFLTSRQRDAFVWIGAADPRARYPMPIDVLGPIVQATTAHEIGHSLGFMHFNTLLAAYPTDSVRNAAFVHRMSYAPSVVHYAFFNYVAQPEDRIAPDDLYPHVGPYDAWALAWGYRPIPDARTPEAERQTLERWRAAQDTAPYLRGAPCPDHVQNQLAWTVAIATVGNDFVRSATYGIRNLARIAGLIDAQRVPGAPQAALTQDLRQQTEYRWVEELGMAIEELRNLASAATSDTASPETTSPGAGQWTGSSSESPSGDSARYAQALRFVLAHTFYGQDELLRQHVLRSPAGTDTTAPVLFEALTPDWAVSDWQNWQQLVLKHLLARSGIAPDMADGGPMEGPTVPDVLQAVFWKQIRALDNALARATPTDPAAKAQRQTLRELLAQALSNAPADTSP